MTDDSTVFRTKVEQPKQEPQEEKTRIKSQDSSPISNDIEVPYLDYRTQNAKPYLVEHFKLGNTWDDPQGGFPKEIEAIEGYIRGKIESGEVANSIGAIKEMIKKMEKFNNLSKEDRAVIKIETLAHYVEFLQKNDKTRQNLRRYSAYSQ